MDIQLIVRPLDAPLSWEEFCNRSQPYSVALDGYVNEGPRQDLIAPRVNFNHHEGVERDATRATCGQALMAMRMGFYRRFCNAKGPHAFVWVNDCDEDVGSAWTVLNNPDVVCGSSKPVLNRLIGMVDHLDSTAGAYPYDVTLQSYRNLNWSFHPYREFRTSRQIDRRDPDDFRRIILETESRLLACVHGHGGEMDLDMSYKTLYKGPEWTLFKEEGHQGRIGAFRDGVSAYVIVWEREEGGWAYTIGRISQFIPFDVPAIVAAFNETEGDSSRQWGCGNTVGGSNRSNGSRLSPETVISIVDRVVTTGY
jgi:hypothetical protein